MKSWTGDYTNRLKKIIDRISPEDGNYICKVICSNPFTGIYHILLILYVFILGGFLLWPFDFLIRNDARWIGDSKGIEFVKIGKAVSNSFNQEFCDRLLKGKGLTLEVLLQTEDLNQSGPARILSYSVSTGLSNFTLGQYLDKLVVRLRTTKTSLKGTTPHIVIIDTFNHRNMQHIVITYDFSEQNVYIDGVQKARSNVLKGDFSNWDPSSILVIGNEVTGSRPWKGKIYYVAVFDRALTEKEIRQNYHSGLRSKIDNKSTNDNDLKAKGPLLRYLFDERKGNVIHDTGSGLRPVNLFLPEYIWPTNKTLFTFSSGYLQSKSRFSDIILNIVIFIPLGILIHGMLRSRYELTLKISLAALLAGTVFSLSIESLQHLSIIRNSSLIDVSSNMTGVAIGIVLERLYNLFLYFQAKNLQMLLFEGKE